MHAAQSADFDLVPGAPERREGGTVRILSEAVRLHDYPADDYVRQEAATANRAFSEAVSLSLSPCCKAR